MKFLKSFTIALTILLATISSAHASGLMVRVESPDSPTNDKEFRLSFVALDIDDRPVTVTCFKKGPTDGSFTQFDNTKSLVNGGNSDYCQVTTNEISPIGTYEFYVVAKADGDTATSSTVSVTYDDSRPGKPENYTKEQTNDCSFKITFRTANDGKTTKVEVYRSDSSNFDVNSGTRVGEVALGPNQNGEFVNTVPDCAKTYYFALRSFDNAGNTSDPVGDAGSFTTITTTTSTSGSNQSGPIAVNSNGTSSGGQILGETDIATDSSEPADGEVVNEQKGVVEGAMDKAKEALKTTNNKVMVGLGALVLATLVYYWYKKSRS
jgi:hypothetical protein